MSGAATIIAFHKPKGLCVEQGQAPTHGLGGRKRVLNDYLADLTAEHQPKGRLSAVGRLDKDTTGLLLLTDDGILTESVLRPGRCAKIYEATIKLRAPLRCTPEMVQRLVDGVELVDGHDLATEIVNQRERRSGTRARGSCCPPAASRAT